PTSVGWQIDPFGHFARLPRLLANSGFTHLVLGRMSHDTLYALRMRHALQFLWQAKDTGGGGAAHHPLLTHFLSTHYAFPAKELDFDHTESCDVPRLLRVLRRYALQQVRQYPGHGHVLVMLGDDFRYVAAERAFACIDRLVAHQGLPGITLRYSTPSEYFASVEPHLLDPAQPLYRLKGDLYPYQDKPYEQYWAGILASRMRLKRAVRLAEHCVQHAEALVAAGHVRARSSGLRDAWETTLEQHMEEARKQVAIGYHHDAITGTCSHTAYLDYLDRLQHAERTALRVARVALLLSSGQAMTDALVSRELSTERRPELAYSTMQDHAHALDAALHVPASVCSAESCAGTLVVVSN
ncbi:mannosyl-oligosaccharide 1,3-1,6-alpha-mannosidase activity protein, partial [Coemansia sp. RSA 2603]